MASLGSLIVRVGADIANFQSDMGRASKLSKQRGAEMKKALVGASKAIGIAAGAAGVAVAGMVASNIKRADELQKLTQRIGGSTEAFSQLEHVAERSGVTFQTMSTGLQRMTRRIAEVATTGRGEAKPALEALGLSAEALANIPLDKKFEVVAEALNQVENSGEKTRLAMKLFDTEGVALLQTMTNGAAGIQEMRKEADALGLTISGDTAAAAELFNDNMSRMKGIVTGVGRVITEHVLPTLNDLFSKMVNVADGSTFAADAGKFLSKALRTVVAAALFLKNVFEAASKVIVAFGLIVINTFKALISPITSFVKRTGEAFDHLSKGNFKKAAMAMGKITGDVKNQFINAGAQIANAATDLGREAFGDLREGIDGVLTIMDDTTQTITTDLVPALGDSTEGFRQSAEQTEAARKEAAKLDSMFISMEKTLDSVAAAERDFNNQVAMLETLLRAGKISRETFNEWLEQATMNYKEANAAATGYTEQQDKMAKAAEEAAKKAAEATKEQFAIIENSIKRLDDTFANFWRDALRGTVNILDAIKNVFLDTLAQMIHAATTKKIVLSFGAALGIGGSSAAAAATGGAGSAIGSALGAGLFGAGGLFAGFMGGAGASGISSALFGGVGSAGPVAGFFPTLGSALSGSMGIMPLVGAIGGLVVVLGGLLGVFSGRNPNVIFNNQTGSGQDFFDTAFGRTFIEKARGGTGHVSDPNSAAGKLKAAQIEFDNSIAALLSESQLEKVVAAFRNWRIDMSGEAISIENLLGNRFQVVLSTFSQDVQNFVRSSGASFEEQIAAFEQYLQALRVFQVTLSAFVESDPSAAFAVEIAEAQRTSTEKLAMISASIRDLFDGFDGSPEQLTEIAQLVDARYRGEIEYLRAVSQLITGINQSVQAQQDKIREALDGPNTATFDEALAAAQSLFAQLASAQSPEAIAQLVSQIQNLVDVAFGGLDVATEAGRAGANQLIELLSQVAEAATTQAELLAQQVIDEGNLLREQAAVFADSIGVSLEPVVEATDNVSATIQNQTIDLNNETRANRDRIDVLIELMRENNRLGQLNLDLIGVRDG